MKCFPPHHPTPNMTMLRGDRATVLVAISLLAPVTVLSLPADAAADDLSAPHYTRDVLPILAEHCFACHGTDEETREAGLRLDRREAAIDFGAFTPGDAESSELVSRIVSDDPYLVMPPPETKKPLSDDQREVLRRWIDAGAEYEEHWALLPPRRPSSPDVARPEWVKSPIDRFVLAKLDELGLEPAAEAEPRVLFRRLHLDITGLPPSPDAVNTFVDAYRRRGDAALSKWIDLLMDRPAWGEHRARYWLDAARYGDTHGLHFDNYREMWPYRDWVIRAFNANQPFDEFTVEQLAGDLLPDPSEDQLIATGFQRCNITTNEGGTIDEENLANYASDRVQTFGWIYLGLTTNCSQCHDHKFDPITMRDYYGLAAYFRNTTQGPKDGNVKDGRGPALVVPTDEDRPRWEALPDEIAAAERRREERKQEARPAWKEWLTTFTPESLEERLSADELVLHLPLTQGATKDEADEVDVGDGASNADVASGVSVASRVPSDRSFSVPADLTWTSDGKLGPAPQFASGATIELGDFGDFDRDDAFTVSVWVKTAKADASAGIVARMDEKSAHRGWDLWQNGRSFSMHLIDSWPDNAIKVSTQRNVVKPGQWQHVAAAYDGSGKASGVKIVIDGQDQPIKVDRDTLGRDASTRSETSLRLGQRSDGAVFDGGSVQDLRLYRRVLGVDEAKRIADAPAIREILAIADAERSGTQRAVLFQHYLAHHDPDYPRLVRSVRDLEAEREAIRQRSPVTHIQEEKPDSKPTAHILMRGEYDNPGEEVTAAPPAALHPMPEGVPNNRLGLARWVVDPANPLTPRVTVNRFWQQVFGRGLVETVEDFGVMGAMPSHPELLDWLATEFRDEGWDVKRLFKQILMSATYRQAAVVTPAKLEVDPDNMWLSRGPRYRMDAEMVRDAALAMSGLLSKKMYGPGVKPYQPEAVWSVVGLPSGNTRNYDRDDGEALYRRTVYSFWKRMAPPPNMEAFNAPSREVCTVRRERTNTPLQALVTLNDTQFFEAARRLAEEVLRSPAGGSDERIDQIAMHVLGRSWSDEERKLLRDDRRAYLEHYEAHPAQAAQVVAVGESAPTDAIPAPELAAWTMVCNQVLNLDEAITK